MHYVVFSEKEEMTAEDRIENAVEITKRVKRDKNNDWKALAAIVGIFLTFGGIVWTGATMMANKANSADVVNLDRTLSELKVVIENMNKQIGEIKDEIKGRK
jgi:hypothetical protein